MTARRPVNGRIRSERGLGAITQRGDSWVWRRSVFIDGRRKWIWDRYPAEAAARAAQAAAKPATPGDALTVGEWLTRWSEQHVVALDRVGREAYAETIDGNIRRYLIPLLGHIRLCALTPADADDAWVRMLTGVGFNRPLSRKTTINARSVLRNGLRAAQRARLISDNAAQLSDLPQLHRGDKSETAAAKTASKTLTLDDARTLTRWLYAHLDDYVWALPTLTALELGARRGEVTGLNWPDIDTTTGAITIKRQYARVSRRGPKQYELRVLKTGASDREVTASPRLIAALATARRAQEVRPIDDGVFVDAAGTRLNPDSWGNWYSKTMRSLNLPARGLHALRHTHASILSEELGIPEREVGARLGHASPATTAKYRGHTRATDQRSANAWADFIGDGTVG